MTAPDPGVGLGHLFARLGLVEARVRAMVEHRRRDDPTPDDPFRGLYLTDDPWFSGHPVTAFMIASFAGMVISYRLSRAWTFKHRPPRHADGGPPARDRPRQGVAALMAEEEKNQVEASEEAAEEAAEPTEEAHTWFAHVAEDLLRTSHLGVAAIGRRVGYESEEAFSRAFKREHGVAPSAWRTLAATTAL